MIGSTVPAVIERLFAAINRHDAEGVASCMALDYCGEQPLHPERRAHDREQMRRNWRTVFVGTPGLTLRRRRTAVVGETVWVEIAGVGRRARDGAPVEVGGVMIFGVADDLIQWDRLYLEPHLMAEPALAGVMAEAPRD